MLGILVSLINNCVVFEMKVALRRTSWTKIQDWGDGLRLLQTRWWLRKLVEDRQVLQPTP